jgi:hypothetical protein
MPIAPPRSLITPQIRTLVEAIKLGRRRLDYAPHDVGSHEPGRIADSSADGEQCSALSDRHDFSRLNSASNALPHSARLSPAPAQNMVIRKREVVRHYVDGQARGVQINRCPETRERHGQFKMLMPNELWQDASRRAAGQTE